MEEWEMSVRCVSEERRREEGKKRRREEEKKRRREEEKKRRRDFGLTFLGLTKAWR